MKLTQITETLWIDVEQITAITSKTPDGNARIYTGSDADRIWFNVQATIPQVLEAIGLHAARETLESNLRCIGIPNSEIGRFYEAIGHLAAVGAGPELVTDLAYASAAGRIDPSILAKHGITIGGEA